jgi:hypothetical protein
MPFAPSEYAGVVHAPHFVAGIAALYKEEPPSASTVAMAGVSGVMRGLVCRSRRSSIWLIL